ncbi:MAG: SLBB domain-containing protein [Armatimonadetes bacterium]|nr:SLBB domain-containing protein [Armatimonadota bacterium]
MLEIIIHGFTNEKLTTFVSPEGKIFVPPVGELCVRDRSLAEFPKYLKAQLSRHLKQFDVSCLLMSFRTFRVQILGEVKSPGSYLVNPLTRVSDVITTAGGLSAVASYRQIEVRRDNGNVEKSDLFKLLRMGDSSQDKTLRAGDVIYVPLARESVVVKNGVVRPGKYELKEGETLGDILTHAGSLVPDIAVSEASIERIGKDGQKEIIKLNLDDKAESRGTVLRDGDIVTIPPMLLYQGSVKVIGELVGADTFQKTVNRLSGATELLKVGTYRLRKGERVRDLVYNLGGPTVKADLEAARIERTGNNGELEAVQIDLSKALADPSSDQNVALQVGDTFMLPPLPDNIYILGEVGRPGAYPYNIGIEIREYLTQAGGFTNHARISSARVIRVANPKPRIFSLDLRKVLQGEETVDFSFRAGDVLFVPRSEIVGWRDIVTVLSEAYFVRSLIQTIFPK